ncbi:MAG: response regulator transcription factor [Candidatus Carbobacillus altaicus]|nr:response regulator transcription factor [Candidatus Carbobacillus altaicus]
MATVLIVDDDRQIRTMLMRALTFEGFQVREAEDGQSADRWLEAGGIDVILLDIGLPDRDGFKLLETWRRLYPGIPVLMVTARDDVEARVKGLDAGADDYIVKPFYLAELVARVRAALRRTHAVQQEGRLVYADLSMDLKARRVMRGGKEIELSGRSFDLLQFFLEHPRQVLSKEQILNHIWGTDAEVDANSVEVYIAHLRQKLETGGDRRLIHTVRGIGYVLEDRS